jgi:predicted  nucleic acid-binding Zn-ribbon protein
VLITGKDEKSLWALERLAEGWKVGNLKTHGFTESQAKKISQFYNCLVKLERFGQPEHVAKWKELGLKGLVLIKMFREKDWEGIGEILMAVDPEIKRDELAKYPAYLEEKRRQVEDTEWRINDRLRVLSKKKQELVEAIEQAKKEREQVKASLSQWFEGIEDEETIDFLMDHLGLKNGKLCLAKRLDYLWQRNLKKKGVITFLGPESEDYLHLVHDVKAIADEYKKRKKRGYRTHWDSDKVPVSDYMPWSPPYYPEYENIKSLTEISGKKLTSEKKKIKEIEKEIAAAEKELKEFRKRRPESFAEALHRSNQFASIDLEKHGELLSLGLKWLYSQGYVATAELTLPGNLRADAIGYNRDGKVCILECKADLHDFYRDQKWKRYLAYCDSFYFVMPKNLAYYDERMGDVGLLKANAKNLELVQECGELEPAKQKEETMLAIGRQLSRRYTFGY